MLLRAGLLSAVLIHTLHMINGQDCTAKFQNGQDGFVVDADTSVRRGAVVIASTLVAKAGDCVEACCQRPQCNVVLVEQREEGSTCALFNCLYKQEFACRFVRKNGFSSFVLKSVYQQHLEAPGIAGKPAGPVAVAGHNMVVRQDQTVTLSGAESRAPKDATITDYKWSLQNGGPSAVTEATVDPLLVNLKPGTYVYKLQVTDSNSQSDTATVKILVLDQEESDMYCLAPQEVGLCRASFQRWHYNAASVRCEKFVYGGCKGNRNNFLSEKECADACDGIKAPSGRTVRLPDMVEDCTILCSRGHFECKSGCCVDRSLECDGTAQCKDKSDETACSQLNKTFSSLLKIDIDDSLARCTEPPKDGPCHGNQSAWYYNPHQRQCHPFTFSSCGNGNNFESKETCEQTCKGVTEKAVFALGTFEELEETESGSIAIAIVLAVSILVLLAVLSFFFLKGHKKRAHQPVATTPPPPGDGSQGDDTVVYRSTTKPV